VIGYYGAIAEWFDVELVRAVATQHAAALVLLVGADTIGAAETLSGLANVHFVGEVEYARLPYWLHGFDVCLLPFKVIPLTIATNPVKVYEYLSAGKPVVSVDLPEMAQFGGLVDVAGDPDAFIAAIGARLARRQTRAQVEERQAFAVDQTWARRADRLEESLHALRDPRVSIIVLTYNNLDFSKACLASIEHHSDYGNIEVLVVDNLSTDGSREWLARWAEEPSAAGHTRRLLLNDRNAGFAAGNNVGLRAATGDYVVILNNDTFVTPGWLRTLCAHFRRDPRLGLVGPVTNNIGNEAKLDIDYQDMEQMLTLAGEHTRAHPGSEITIATIAFFCVAMPRRVLETVGELDEAFGIGFFEDDDYCRRVEQAGFRVACAEDVFVHHHLSASFAKMQSEEKRELFERNKRTYEAKWGTWTPHVYRDAKQG
jgi:GT2 family glycosyltransferase